MPAFVALLGRRLTVSALIDGVKSNTTFERVKAAAEANDVPVSSLIVCSQADDGLPRDADIEDLFAVKDYLQLYNWAFSASVTEDELPEGNDRILKRLLGVVGAFDHALPAHALTRNFAEFVQSIDEQSVSRFEKLFVLLNATVSD